MLGKEYKISFIVPALNCEKFIVKCIKSIVEEAECQDEIFVVDNGSTDQTVELVKKFSQVKIIDGDGLTVGGLRNKGAAFAKGDLLAFVDSDCLLCPGWRLAVERTFRNETIAATGAKYLLPEETTWIERAWFSQKRNSPGVVNYINSGNFCIRKRVFIASCGFDDDLLSGEDAEFCQRLREHGFVVYENPMIKAVHLGNPKNICGFYKQQRWHALGMFGTMRSGKFDKPVIMTFLFLFFSFCFLGAELYFMVLGDGINMLNSFFIALIVPVVTSIYRIFQYKKVAFVPQLVMLYLFYYVARSVSLFEIFLSRFNVRKI